MKIAVVCVGVLGLLVFGLGFAVSMARREYRIGSGYPDDPTHPLHKRVRAHANTCEYAPLLAVLILYHGLNSPGVPMQALMLATTACRLLIVAGILVSPTLARPHPLRFIGAVGTYLGGLGLALATLASVA